MQTGDYKWSRINTIYHIGNFQTKKPMSQSLVEFKVKKLRECQSPRMGYDGCEKITLVNEI